MPRGGPNSGEWNQETNEAGFAEQNVAAPNKSSQNRSRFSTTNGIGPKTAAGSEIDAQQMLQDGVLGVESVLGLLEDQALWAVENL